MNRVIFRSLIAAFVLFVAFCVPSIASADPVLWILTGVTFGGIDQTTGLPSGVTGGTATGSFDYNSATNTFTNISITTTAGSGFGGATYTTLSAGFPGFSSSTGIFLGASSGDLTGLPLLLLFFNSPLVNSGGTVTDLLTTGIDFGGGEGTCDDAGCVGSTEDRFITGGAATSTVAVVTPEPSALSLLGVALAALLAGAAIRKASQA